MRDRKTLILVTLLVLAMIVPLSTLGAAERKSAATIVSTILKPEPPDEAISFHFGWIGMLGLRGLLCFSDVPDDVRGAMKEISGMRIHIFEQVSDNMTSAEQLARIETEMLKAGRTLFLRVRDKSEHVLFFFSEEKGSIISLTGVIQDKTEIVLLEIEGDLNLFIQSICTSRKSLVAKNVD